MQKKTLLTTLFMIAFCVLATSAQSSDVKLGWNPNDTAPDAYVLSLKTDGGSYDLEDRTWTVAGTITEITVTDLTEGETYTFGLRAEVGGHISAMGDEVVYTIPSPPQTVVIPQRVGGIRIIFE